ncbi:MAG: DUF4351 domain-containing protein [Blastocatellia bacterium]
MKSKRPAKTKKRAEQDSAWKDLLDRYFPEFTAFFFPAIYEEIDWTRKPVFLDKELHKLGPAHETGKRLADKLVKVWLKNGKELWVLLHTEVDGEPDDEFDHRVYVYNYRIVDRYSCEVVSLAVVTGSAGRTARGRYETARWGCEMAFKFPVVRITDWRGREEELRNNPSPFALVVLAQLKLLETRRDVSKKYAAKLELILQLLHSNPDTQQTRDLLRFLDWLFQLPEELEEKLSYDVRAKVEEKRMPYVTSWERIAQKRGEERGEQKGKLAVVLRQLRRQIGALDEKLNERIEKLSSERLDQLADALLDFTQPSDLERWLKRRKA